MKAFASQQGFRIHDVQEFEGSIQLIRQGISRFAEPFNYFFKQVYLPDEVAHIGGELTYTFLIPRGLTTGLFIA